MMPWLHFLLKLWHCILKWTVRNAGHKSVQKSQQNIGKKALNCLDLNVAFTPQGQRFLPQFGSGIVTNMAGRTEPCYLKTTMEMNAFIQKRTLSICSQKSLPGNGSNLLL